MNNLTNYHSHCDFCDGHAPMELFVREAVKEGFSSYGISSHAPFPVQNGCNMRKRENDGLFGRISSFEATVFLRDRFIYRSQEIDFLDDSFNPSIDYFQSLPLDYRIGSVHYIVAPDGTPVDTDGSPERFRNYVEISYFDGDVKGVVHRFYRSSFRSDRAGGLRLFGTFG